MGAGNRRGRHRHRHVRRHRHHRTNITHHNNHHGHHHGTNIILGAAYRRRQNVPSNTNRTFITRFQTSNTSNSQISPSVSRYVPMCRVFSIFLWFSGIMMMSIGGFRTGIGFVGIACLVLGMSFLIITSIIMSNSCGNSCFGNSRLDPEQPTTSGEPASTTGVPGERSGVQGQSLHFTVPIGAPYDPSPSYPASSEHPGDKLPSYEEVISGMYPPTNGSTVLPFIPEDEPSPPIQLYISQSALGTHPRSARMRHEGYIGPPMVPALPSIPEDVTSSPLQPYAGGPGVSSYPSNHTLHQNCGPSATLPDPSIDTQNVQQTSSGPTPDSTELQINPQQDTAQYDLAGSSRTPLPTTSICQLKPGSNMKASIQTEAIDTSGTIPSTSRIQSSVSVPTAQADSRHKLPLSDSASRGDSVSSILSMHLIDSTSTYMAYELSFEDITPSATAESLKNFSSDPRTDDTEGSFEVFSSDPITGNNMEEHFGNTSSEIRTDDMERSLRNISSEPKTDDTEESFEVFSSDPLTDDTGELFVVCPGEVMPDDTEESLEIISHEPNTGEAEGSLGIISSDPRPNESTSPVLSSRLGLGVVFQTDC